LKRPAIFMDRDGTVNEQMGYINHLCRFVLLPRSGEAVRLLNQNGFLAIIVSNQSGVARGYFPIELVYKVHDHMGMLLKQEGAVLDGIFFCPHYPGGKVSEYSRPCDCRKPRTGLIDQACRQFAIDMTNSYVIGDRCTDMELASRSGLRGIMVKTGYGLGDLEYVLPHSAYQPFHVAEDLLDAVRWIVARSSPPEVQGI
jgi:D-glycero-D-manno-heptose 1,7-bisphosphate phosphatase